jgi:hypothetical protein
MISDDVRPMITPAANSPATASDRMRISMLLVIRAETILFKGNSLEFSILLVDQELGNSVAYSAGSEITAVGAIRFAIAPYRLPS